jgi:hypothetical protein
VSNDHDGDVNKQSNTRDSGTKGRSISLFACPWLLHVHVSFFHAQSLYPSISRACVPNGRPYCPSFSLSIFLAQLERWLCAAQVLHRGALPPPTTPHSTTDEVCFVLITRCLTDDDASEEFVPLSTATPRCSADSEAPPLPERRAGLTVAACCAAMNGKQVKRQTRKHAPTNSAALQITLPLSPFTSHPPTHPHTRSHTTTLTLSHEHTPSMHIHMINYPPPPHTHAHTYQHSLTNARAHARTFAHRSVSLVKGGCV